MTAPTQRARRPWRRRILIGLGALGIVVLIGAAGVGILVLSIAHDYDANRRTAPDASFFPVPSERPTQDGGAARNILLLGTDTRGAAPTSLSAIRAQRSDTMMLVHIPADR